MSKKWAKPLLIGVVILIVVGIILIAVLANSESSDERVYLDDEVVEVKNNDDYQYNVYGDGSIGILSYLGTKRIITIPETIDDAPVTRIEAGAFLGSQLTGIVLPETIQSIGDNAFYGCESLSSLTIHDNVSFIGKDAFLIEKNNTSSFIPWINNREEDFVIVGDGILIAYIGSASESMKIPGNVKHICRFYFRGSSIQSVTLPEKLRSIGDSAFEDFTKITSIKIPSTVTEIGNRSFYNCKALKSISLPEAVKTVGNEAFACCPKLKTAKLPGVTTIGDRAFAYCLSLTSVKLPSKGLLTIGDSAFSDCSLLKDIVIPNSIESLGPKALHATAWMNDQKDKQFVITANGMLVGYNGPGGQVTIDNPDITVVGDAFAGRTDITGVILGNSVLALSDSAFENCTELEAVITSKYLEKIGERAFAGCTSLSQVELLNGILTIGFHAFEGCSSLISVELPEKLQTIPAGCFLSCTSLSEVTLPASIKTVERGAFNQCALEKINYEGTSKQKKKIKIADNNQEFTKLLRG